MTGIYPKVMFGSIPEGILPLGGDSLICPAMDESAIRVAQLKQIMVDEYQGKQRLLAEKLERQPDYISRLFSGKKKLGADLAREFERLLGKPKYYLDGSVILQRFVDSPAFSEDLAKANAAFTERRIQERRANIVPGPAITGTAPLISWVTAGHWCAVADPFEPGVAEDWLPCPRKHGPRTFALRVRGISMENPGGKFSYSDGDVIFVDPDKQAENGSRVVVRLDDDKEATFKQLVIEGERRYLKALNPAWPEKIIEISQDATICGVVIGKWTEE